MDYPCRVVIDTAQNLWKQSREQQERLTMGEGIKRGWMAKKVLALVDTGACCPPPLLISQHYLAIVAPGCALQAVPASMGTMRVAWGEALPFVGGGVNLLIRLSGRSLYEQGD